MLDILAMVLLLASSGDCQSELCRYVAEGQLSDLRWPDFTDYRTHVQDFYEPAGYALAWTRDGAPTKQATAIINVLRQADAKGLFDGAEVFVGDTEERGQPPVGEGDCGCGLRNLDRSFGEIQGLGSKARGRRRSL